MRISSKGVDLIVRFEGEVLEVYRDPVGLPTLGVGHLLTKDELEKFPVGTPISRKLSRAFLAQDLKRFETALSELVAVPLTQNQYDALCSLIFNIGIGNFKKSTLLKKLNKKDYAGAADAFLSWVKAKGKVLPGLVRRRKAERKLFLTPDSKPAVSADVDSASGGEETQTNPSTSPQPSLLDTVLSGVDRAADVETRIGRSSWIKALGAKALGVVVAVGSLLEDHWEVALIGALLIGLGLWYLFRRWRQVKKVRERQS